MSKSAQAAQNIIKAQLHAPHLPWNVTKPNDLGPAIVQHLHDTEGYYRRWAQKWFENSQFIYGNQAVKWSKRYGFAVDTDFLRREPTLAQRSQTNISRVVVEGIASFLFGALPVWDVEPGSQSSVKGKRFQRIVQKMLDAYMERLVMHPELWSAACILATYGQVGGWTDWDYTAGQLLEIPKWQKVKAPIYTDYMAPNPITGGLLEVPAQAFTADGMPRFEEVWEPVLDQMGRQVIDKMFAGDGNIDILTPFEYRKQIGSAGTHKTKFVQRISLLDYDEALDKFMNVPGETGKLNSITPLTKGHFMYDLAMRHFMMLQYTTPPDLQNDFRRGSSIFGSQQFRQKVVVIEHYDKPHAVKWKRGRRVITMNGVCTHVTEPPYTTNKRDGWHPLSEAQWLAIRPNSMATGPLNDSIQKNRELNIKDSLTATAVRRNMGSQLLVKSGAGFNPELLTGEPGAVHEVQDPFAAKWLHDEIPIPAVLPTLRQADKDDIYEVSAVGDSLRGAPATGASSGYQEKQRQEREERRVSPYRREFERFVSSIGEKLFMCVKQNVIQLDDAVMGFMMRSGAGELQSSDVVAVLTQPIDYGVDIKVKESSMAVKSKASMQATMQELAQGALGQRLGTDARVLDEYLKYFDVENLRDASAAHRDRADRENEIMSDFLRLGPNAEGLRFPVVLFEDDDDLHIAYHTEWMLKNTDAIMSDESFMRQVLMHIEWHRLNKQEKQGQLMPGTAMQIPQMYATAQQVPKPNAQTIQMYGQQQQMMKQQQAQQPQQAPTQPTGGPNGQRATDPNAPSQNTPKGTVEGGVK